MGLAVFQEEMPKGSELWKILSLIHIFLGIVEEVDDLGQGLLGLILTGHVPEGDAGGLFHIHLGVGLAHAADAARCV